MALFGWFSKGDKAGDLGAKEAPATAPAAPVAAGRTGAGRTGAGRTGTGRAAYVPAAIKAAPPPPPPPPREKIFSPRRILLAGETTVLIAATILCLWAWKDAAGGWPSRASILPPRQKVFWPVAGLEIRGNELWVVGKEGLVLTRLNRRPWPFRRFFSSLPSWLVTSVAIARNGTWIGTIKGLTFHDGNRLDVRNEAGPLKGLHITALAVDGEGTVWAGTARDGLFAKTGKKWRRFLGEISSPYVTALAPAGRRGVWVGVFSGGLVRTDGVNWDSIREPVSLKGKTIRTLTAISADSVLALTDVGLYRVGTGGAWRPVKVPQAVDDTVVRVVRAEGSSRFALLTRKGAMFWLDAESLRATPIEEAGPEPATALAAGGGVVYFSRGDVVWRIAQGRVLPLTDWGIFMNPERYQAPGPDLPSDWKDPKIRVLIGDLAAVSLLLGIAFVFRGARWRNTDPRHEWRVAPLQMSAIACAALAGLYLTERYGLVSTRANILLWKPVYGLAALMLLAHGIRMAVHEWALRSDAFWLGFALLLSLTGAWLWWGQGALIPAIITCALSGLFFGRSLKGLRTGTWKRGRMAWGILVFVVQLCALVPPLLFAMKTWGMAAFTMKSTNPIFSRLAYPPSRLVWSDDGQLAAYATITGPASCAVAVADARDGGWKVVYRTVPTVEVYPRTSPDSASVAWCYRKGADTIVELASRSGNLTWRTRIPGPPVSGRQPLWAPDGKSMIVMTYAGRGTHLWRLDRGRGDAERMFIVSPRLAWPSMDSKGARIFCAVTGEAMPGLACVTLSNRRVAMIEPDVEKSRPLLVYAPSEEGLAILVFLNDGRDRTRRGLARVRERIQVVFNYFGWRSRVPELWIRRKPPKPRIVAPSFRWKDYDLVRDVIVSVDGRTLACIVHRGNGRDEILHMLEGGGNLLIAYGTPGRLTDLRWAPFKNRLMAVEELDSALAPFPVRNLLIISGIPESVSVKPMVPFASYVASPEFSPDGRRVIYVAQDRFWDLLSIMPAPTYGLFEATLEDTSGASGPPAALTGSGGTKKEEPKAH